MNEEHNPNSYAYSIECPVGWPRLIDAHCTVLYLGQQSKTDMDKVLYATLFERFNTFGYLNSQNKPIQVKTQGLDLFGENKNIPVVKLVSTSLFDLNRYLEDYFTQLGISSKSKFTKYNPHISIPEIIHESMIPDYIDVYPPRLVRWKV